MCAVFWAMGTQLSADVLAVGAVPVPPVSLGPQTQLSPFVAFTTVNLYHLRAQLQSQYASYSVPGSSATVNAPEYGLDAGAELLTKSLTPWTSLAFGFRFEDVLNTMSEVGDVAGMEYPNTYNSYLLDGLVGARWTTPLARRWTVSLGLFAGPGYANIGDNQTQPDSARGTGDVDGYGFVVVADFRLSYALPVLPALLLNADLGWRYASFGPLSNVPSISSPTIGGPYAYGTPSGEDFSGIIVGVGASYGF